MEEYNFRSGTIPGYSHTRKKKNNQDACALNKTTISGKEYFFGVVSDGCTGAPGSKTEVGSILITQFIVSEIFLILSTGVKLEDLPQILFPRCIGFFRAIAGSTVIGSPDVMWEFIRKNLLCTILGFVMNESKLVIFNAGDGMVIVDNDIRIIDQNDVPDYLAYRLVDRTILGKSVDRLAVNFEVNIYNVSDVNRFAICTDGLTRELKKSDTHIVDLNEIWKYEPTAKAGLQWWLNIQSADNSCFEDDTTIIAFQKLGP
jgi:serine/threonine protein phosphatase PrpC